MSEEAAAESGQEATVDPAIEKARAAGWKPQDQFDGDVSEWVDAGEFLRRAPLYAKNKALKRELSDLKSTLHEVKGHISKVSQAAYERARADLEAQRDAAIEDGDKAAVREIDKQIRETEQTMTPPPQGIHPAIAEWEAKNGEWFYADKEISVFGHARAAAHLSQHPGDIEGALEVMEKAVRRAFPEKFETANPKRTAPPAVEGGGDRGGKKTFGVGDLDEEQRRVMNRFVRAGTMTKEQYIKDLAEMGLIGGKK